MQPDGTYQLIETLGSCQVGTVWSAIDAQGRSLSVAVLDAAVAADQRWRDAFAATADALLQAEPGGPRFLYADYAASAPWVACAAGEGPGAERVFQDLGMEYHPSAAGTEAASAGVPDSHPHETASSPVAEQPFVSWPTVGLQPVSSPPPPVSSPPVSFPVAPPPVPVSPPPVPVSPPVASVSSQPVSAPPEPVSGGPQPVSDAPQPVSGGPQPVSDAPQPVSGGPQPVSDAPQPVSGVPQSPAVGPLPPVSEPLPSTGDLPQWTPRPAPPRPLPPVGDIPQSPPPFDSGYPRLRPSEPDEPRRRTGLWITIAIAVVVALAAGSGVYAWRQSGGKPTAAPSSSPEPVAMPTASPLKPGIEPPRPGDWPRWPMFGTADQVRTLDLEGVGFPLTVPATWQCTNTALADGYVKYQCGDDANKDQEIGGELVVRECQQPCDEERRATLRKSEEAWGLQWRDGGPYSVLAETLKLDGASRYALVFVAFFRSAPDSAVDRELVFRMTSPVSWCDTLRRVANAVRDRTGF